MKIDYAKMKKLFEKKGVTPYRVCKDLKLSHSLFPRWRDGIAYPKYDKIKIIADYFDVDILYFYDDIREARIEQLLFDNELDDESRILAKKNLETFYTNPEVQMITQELHDRPEMRGLFSAARNLDADQMKKAVAIIEAYAKEDDDEV